MPKEPDQPSSILIIRLSSLGDILLTTPILRCLHRSFPQTRLDVLVRSRYSDLLSNNPNINTLVTLNDPADFSALRGIEKQLRGRYEVVVDLHTSLRSSYLRKGLSAKQILIYDKRRWARWLLVNFKLNRYPDHFSIPQAYFQALRPLGVVDDGLGLDWPEALLQRDVFLQSASLTSAPDPKPVALCPGASYATKRWPLDYWTELVEGLLQRGQRLWIFGDKNDVEAGEQLQAIDPERVCSFCGKLSIAQSGAGLSCCSSAITNDAGPAHMASAVKVPVVAIFGSTVPQFGFKPYGVPHRVAEIETHLHCRPCSHLGYPICPLEHHRCMKDVKPEQVLRLWGEVAEQSSTPG
ncbi:MAG: glycosyltransferase family 9 protein [bacterium]|nr:glycosyltransferase family 9 protein [bacterium]